MMCFVEHNARVLLQDDKLPRHCYTASGSVRASVGLQPVIEQKLRPKLLLHEGGGWGGRSNTS